MNKQMISKSNVHLGKIIVLSFGISLQMRSYIGHVCIYKNIYTCSLNCFAVYQKLTQPYKITIFQFKTRKKEM